ncbi:MAG TPA: hypothetical protein VH062_20100 [Polyangiaceae bacterium]|nr:hypothetical protein [Polyangiaceae bacterium]
MFSQGAGGALPVAAIARNAEMHFASRIALTVEAASGDFVAAYRAELELSEEQSRTGFSVRVRPTTPADVALAVEAEQRGSAAGMSALAARCPSVWVVEPDAGAAAWAIWECCALLALTALGPILPPDHSTLLGVRSARARATRARVTQ